MKNINKFLVLAILLSFMGASHVVQAEEYCVDNGGCGYNDCCRTTSLAPAIALGTIVVVAVVAVLVQNTSGSAHCHTGKNNNCH